MAEVKVIPNPRAATLRRLLRETDPGDECPVCQCGTVEHVDGYVKCRGECGACVPATEEVAK